MDSHFAESAKQPTNSRRQERDNGAQHPKKFTSPSTIRLLFLKALFSATEDLGHRLDPILRELGFARTQLDRPYDRAPLQSYVALLEQVSERFKRPYLGLEMAGNFSLDDLGPFHALLHCSVNLRAALDTLALFQSRVQSRTAFESHVGLDATLYCYRIEDTRIWPRRQDAEFAMASYCTLVRQLTHQKWVPVEVHFEHNIAGREEKLSHIFKAPVRGNQSFNALKISNDDLDKAFVGNSTPSTIKLHSILETHLLDLMDPADEGDGGILARTRDAISRRLGRTHIDLASIAAEQNLSERSLRRRLREADTSFRMLLQEARQARAQLMLEGHDLPLSLAAEQLGYSDTATFSRAFKKWTGISPGRFARLPEA